LKVSFYDIKAQYDELHDEIDSAVLQVMASGVYTISGGKECPTFEQEIADLHGVKHGIAVNSGTDALRILLDAAGIGPGDEVITPSFTFVASVETILQTGAHAVFADINLETFCLDPASIEAAITPRTKAILPVHLFGQLADVEAITKIAKDRSLLILEDAAQAIGCTHDGIATGNYGIGAALSFYVTKNLGAAGDGGMIITNNDEIALSCRSLRVHGMGRERYYYDQLGFTSRLDEVQAAYLRVKLSRLDEWNRRRGRHANHYLQALSGIGLQLPKISAGNNHTWHQFSIRSPQRDELRSFLASKGIDTMIYYPVPIHHHSPYLNCLIGPTGLSNSDQGSREILNLPVHPHLSDDKVQFVTESIAEFQKKAVSPAGARG